MGFGTYGEWPEDNQGRTRALPREEHATPSARSGLHDPSSGDTGRGAAPGIAPRTTQNTLMDDLGFDDVYRVHDGLGPDELDIEVEFEEWRDPWTTEDKWVVGILATVIVLAWFAGFAGWLS